MRRRSDGSRSDTTLLQERSAELLRKPWCEELMETEGAVQSDVEALCKDQISKLPHTASLRIAARDRLTAEERLQKYKTLTRPVLLSACGVILLSATSFFVTQALADEVVLSIVAAGYMFLVFCWVPFVVRSVGRRRSGLKNAPADLSIKRTDLDRRLRTLIGECVRNSISLQFEKPEADRVQIEEGIHLSSRAVKGQRIGTPSASSIELHLLRTGGAAVGVTGERGVGKSEVLRSFSDDSAARATVDEGGTIGVLVPVPAAFDGIQFLKLTVRRLAEAVPGAEKLEKARIRRDQTLFLIMYLFGVGFLAAAWFNFPYGISTAQLLQAAGSASSEKWVWAPVHTLALFIIIGLTLISLSFKVALSRRLVSTARPTLSLSADAQRLKTARTAAARSAQDVIARLKFSETVKVASEGSLTLGKGALKRSKERSLVELPHTETDLVDEFRILTDSLANVGYRIFVCIDEMDKLEDGKPTENFLNSIKQLFAVRSCSFLVSVSDSAWARFSRRGIELRDALDSSLDAIEKVTPMELRESRSLIRHRGEKGISDTQVLLCHVLSGGLPRETLRTTRSLAQANRARKGNSLLADVAKDLVEVEAQRLIDASAQYAGKWDPAVRDPIILELSEIGTNWREAATQNVRAAASGRSPEAAEVISRVHLLLRFYRLVEAYFSSPCRVLAAPTEQIIETASKTASLRREIDRNPVRAEAELTQLEI